MYTDRTLLDMRNMEILDELIKRKSFGILYVLSNPYKNEIGFLK